ncbi:nudix hydrolase 10 isoform X2 [Photinus pyralis]|uniref:nudix hydrolase 10 isoform X2 n=1 Tax=Photinus pyralis TaxID=7054 RepID=UPI00126755EC|nr:nudix hydrolase 10 isoform X2 [Photinus pyralis]
MPSLLINLINRKVVPCKFYRRLNLRNLSNSMSAAIQPFKGLTDRFNGVTVDSQKENCELPNFLATLEESMKVWETSKKRGIWFKVDIQQSDWVPILAKKGFNFHHANTDYVMMFRWLPKEENNVPSYAHTMVGVGAVVVNDKSELLVVRERYGFTNWWKLPGGYVEPAENIVDAAIREVYEETHISTEFHSMLTMTQAHERMFGCSDLYFIVSLIPTSTDIEKCDREISECQWMKIDEYLDHDSVTELNKFFIKTYLNYKSNCITINCKHGIHSLLKKAYTVHYATKIDEK